MRRPIAPALVLISLATALGTSASAMEITKAETNASLTPLPMLVGGRTVVTKSDSGHPLHRFQWPGVYFTTAFAGAEIYFEVGTGRAIFHVLVDDLPPLTWDNRGAGTYAVRGIGPGPHTVRVELVTECQGGPVEFGGFSLGANAKPATPTRASRQIEFIGDSHTVGYGNTSPKRQCTPDEIWATTDTSQAFGVLVAKHFHADYRINAISGRGIVRNYGGFAADPLPAAYPYALFDKQQPVATHGWDPAVIVVALGTNDFSTPLGADEKWKSRDALHADFEQTYVKFVQTLRAAHPHAFLFLAANDSAEGEIQAEVRKVVQQLSAAGEKRVQFIAFNQLELTGCDWHPSLADQRKMAGVLIDALTPVLKP